MRDETLQVNRGQVAADVQALYQAGKIWPFITFKVIGGFKTIVLLITAQYVPLVQLQIVACGILLCIFFQIGGAKLFIKLTRKNET